jgi:hypothetical protein
LRLVAAGYDWKWLQSFMRMESAVLRFRRSRYIIVDEQAV